MATPDDDGTWSSTRLDEEGERLLRGVAAAPPRRPPTTAFAGARWGADGRYVIEAKVGRGGMGTVYAASDVVLARKVALKVLDGTDMEEDAAARERLLREARLAARFEHDRVARIYDVGTHEGVDFVAMELVRGVTLRQRLREGAPPPDEIVTIVVQIAEALRELHSSGVVHRDLKPDNVMLTETRGVKLLDFGLARAIVHPDADDPASSQATRGAGSLLSGTPGYMAPEQCAGLPLDARADVFALGVICHELVTGARLFSGKTPAALMRASTDPIPPLDGDAWARAPAGLRAVAQKMLAVSPADRFADGGAVLDAMTGSVDRSDKARDAVRRLRHRVTFAFVALLVAGLAVTGAVVVGRRIARERGHARALAAPPPPGMALVKGGPTTIGMSVDAVSATCAEIGPKCDRDRLAWSVPSRQEAVAPFYLDLLEATNGEMVDLLNGMRGSLLVVTDEEWHFPRYVRFNEGLGHDGEILLDLFDATSGVEYVRGAPGVAGVYRTRPGREHWPVTQVTLFGARTFCASRGKRLPTEVEWEAAARGTDDRKYPWGNAPARCGAVRLPSDGNIPFETSCPPLVATPADVGTNAQDVNPDGVFDLGGNVSEWTDTVFSLDAVTPGPTSNDVRPYVTRGGSFNHALPARTAVRGRQPPTAAGINGGFRCAQSLSLP